MKRLVYLLAGWSPELGPAWLPHAHVPICMPRRLPKDALTSVLRVYGPLRVLGGGR